MTRSRGALVGGELSTDDLLKLDGTTLFEVLSEEPGFERPEAGSEPAFSTKKITRNTVLMSRSWTMRGPRMSGPENQTKTGTPHPQMAPRFFRACHRIRTVSPTDLEYLEDHFGYSIARFKRVGRNTTTMTLEGRANEARNRSSGNFAKRAGVA